jgi:hypothetical protein
MRFTALSALAASALIVACTAGSQPSPTPAADFTLQVLPVEEPVEARVAIPGERVAFLVTVSDEGSGAGPVTISATAEGASVADIRNPQLEPGTVGEVWVVPEASSVDATATVEVTATRGDVEHAERRTIAIMPMADERAADAQPHFERWVAWLADNQPELGITRDTEWQPTFVSTFLVVSHYAYWSPEWEMVVSWHNMIPPDDWSEIYLRRRDTETAPSLAFRQDSMAGATEPHSVEPPAEVLR